MRRNARWAIVGGLALVLGVAPLAEAKKPKAPAGRRSPAKGQKAPPPPKGLPFALRLLTTKVDSARAGSVGMGLAAMIKNTSDQVQPYFQDDGTWHHSELQLRTKRGHAVKPFDKRSIASVSVEGAAHQRADLDELKPGEEKILARSELTKSKDTPGRCQLRWGPYFFQSLRPGTYRARLARRVQTNRYYDPKAKSWGTVKAMWRGSVWSPWVEVTVPDC